MKVTNYEISKRLADIGFKADFIFIWASSYLWKEGIYDLMQLEEIRDDKEEYDYIPAYDLETILDYLPKQICLISGILYLEITFSYQNSLPYILYRDRNSIVHFSQRMKENESLTDTAAEMLIQLIDKNLIRL